MEKLRASSLVAIGGIGIDDQVVGVMHNLNGIEDEVGPQPQQVRVFSSFYHACLNKMVHFATVTKEVSRATGVPCEPKAMSGLPALQYMAARIKKDLKEGKEKVVEDVKFF